MGPNQMSTVGPIRVDTPKGRTVGDMTPDELLRTAETILLVDWPTRDVPDTLAQAGYHVVASEGPGPEDYNAYEVQNGAVVTRHVGSPPERAEIVYAHRPTDELPMIVELAKQVGARGVWCETGSVEARRIVESAELAYVDRPPIADAVRATGSRP
jgi:predicted CoA-binding protein